MSVKVIGAGFGRTGTASLKAGLEELGFSQCYHMSECFKHPSHAPLWEDAVAGRPADWDAIFDGYQATVDWPGCSFYKELMEVYPDAKVLLSVRDPDGWYGSTLTTIYRVPKSLLLFLLKLILPHTRNLYRMVNASVWDGAFGGRFEDREHAIGVYERHNEDVKRHVPPDRLLVYDVKQGWEPLCHFLNVPVPQDRPFPHLNDAAQIQRLLRWGPWGVCLVLAGAIAGLVALIRG
jgi:hypothetical protein